MSNMLEDAIVDARALREAALKNAENLVVEKYSAAVKEAVQTLLEQDPEEPDAAAALEMPAGDEELEVSAVMDDLPAAHDPAGGDEEVVVIDLDQIIAAADADAGVEDEEFTLDAEEIADEVGIDLEDEVAEEPANRSDEVEIPENDLVNMFKEMLTVDVDPLRIEEVEESEEEDQKESDEEEVVSSALDAGMDQKDIEEHNRLTRQLESVRKENKQLKRILVKVKDRLEEVNLSNARLLYANRVYEDTSLNEQQKNKIAEMVSEARTVEEAKMVYETLQKTLASNPSRKTPQSLSEAVSRRSSVILSGRREVEATDENPVKHRWATLAGIEKK